MIESFYCSLIHWEEEFPFSLIIILLLPVLSTTDTNPPAPKSEYAGTIDIYHTILSLDYGLGVI